MRLCPLCLALLATACTTASTDGKPKSFALHEAPAEYDDAIRRADAAIREVRTQHGMHMNQAMKSGGPTAAIQVCNQEARAITAKMSEDANLKIGRSSPRLRNPKNAPPPWLASFVASLDGKRASEVDSRVFDLGDDVGVVRPIPTAKVCTKCHGKTEALDAKATGSLRETYPDDRATGFEVGDLRGVFWVVVPRS